MIGVVAPVVALEISAETKVGGLSSLCFHPGGQGIDAARAMIEMGEESVLVSFNGGESGMFLRTALDFYGIKHHLVPIAAPTVAVLKLTEDYREKRAFQLPLPRVSRHESDDLYSAASLLTFDCSVVVFSGVAAEGMPTDFFPSLIRHANNHGVSSVVDLEPELMLSVLDANPTVIKPNLEQLAKIFDLNGASTNDLLDMAAELRRRGARNVVISLGGGGALAVADGSAWKFTPPKIEAVVERGAGDCMVATIAVGLARHEPFDEAVRLSIGAGCAKVLRHGLGTCRREVSERLVGHVKVERVR
jgi:1-phosphofructokinase